MTSYAQGSGSSPRATTQSNGMAVAGLVCGIVGLVVFAIILGPLAIIFGAIGLSRARSGAVHGTMAKWAIALGVVDVAIFVALIVAASNNGGSYYVHIG